MCEDCLLGVNDQFPMTEIHAGRPTPHNTDMCETVHMTDVLS
jgi:hypothetical protein